MRNTIKIFHMKMGSRMCSSVREGPREYVPPLFQDLLNKGINPQDALTVHTEYIHLQKRKLDVKQSKYEANRHGNHQIKSYQDLKADGSLQPMDERYWRTFLPPNEWKPLPKIDGQDLHFPPPGSDRKSVVLPFATAMLSAIHDVSLSTKCWIHYNTNDSRDYDVFNTYTPDITVYTHSHCDPMSIVVIGNCTRYSLYTVIDDIDESPFSEECIGTLLDMASVLLCDIHTYRSELYCFLTDGYHIQFYRVYRSVDDTVKYMESPVYGDQVAWKTLALLLAKDHTDLGYQCIDTPHWHIVDILSKGELVAVYEANEIVTNTLTPSPPSLLSTVTRVLGIAQPPPLTHYIPRHIILKVFYTRYDRDHEKRILQYLNTNDVPHVPLCHHSDDDDCYEGKYHLLCTPIYVPCLPCTGGFMTNSLHYRNLLQTIRLAHEIGVIHRDIQPKNIYLCDSNSRDSTGVPTVRDRREVILSNWGSGILEGDIDHAVSNDTTLSGYHRKGELSDEVSDLLSFIRTVYVLYRQITPPDSSSSDALVLQQYWDSCMSGMLWKSMEKAALCCDYDSLDVLLENL